MRSCSILFSALLALTVMTSVVAQSPAASRAEDEAAIQAAIQSYVAAYNAGDAGGVAKHWSDTGEWLNPDGSKVRGRQAIEAEMTEMFKQSPGLIIDVGDPIVRFVSPDVAIEEGVVQVHRSSEAVSESRYLAVHVKRDGRWQLDTVRETETPDLVQPNQHLAGLAWLVGEWIDQSADSTVETSVTWTKNKQFLTYNFRLSLPGAEDLEGTQIIAWDAATGSIRAWLFDSDGTIGEGVWTHDGKHWIVKSLQVLPDGKRASATNIYTVQDNDHFTWKSIARSVDGQFLPNIDEVLVVRKSAAAQPANAAKQAAMPSTRQSSPGNAFQQPSRNQLESFINTPQHSGGRSTGSSPPMASQLPASGGGPRSFTTAGGSTITIGGKGGSGTTAGGAQVGGAVGGIKIEGAGGQTVVKGAGGVGVTDGANSAVRGGSITGVEGTGGNKAVNVRGGYADSAGNRQAGGATAVQGRGGYTAVNVRGAAGANGIGQVGSVSGIRGPGGNVVTAGRGASFVNGQFVSGQAFQAVNGNFTHWNCFSPGWYGRYPGCWWPGKWAVATTAWAAVAWSTAGSYCGCEGDGAYYDYGENVTYEDGMVYADGEPVASDEQYYSQAAEIAQSGETTTDEEWLPLGIFAVITEGQTNSDKVVQLALNKEGAIRGNLHDITTDSVLQVTGAVNKETQRVAFQIEGKANLVVETGLYNLTNDEVPILIHTGPTTQESRTLIRLKQPEDQAPAAGQ